MGRKTHKVYLLLGGNQVDTKSLFQEVNNRIKDWAKIVKASSLYVSPPWGFESKNDFLNQVLILETKFNPTEVLHKCLEIEKSLGRTRGNDENYSDRPIDIDILFFDDLVLEKEELIIPHPCLHLRKFTLLPLKEVDPFLIHPKLKKSIKELVVTCPDKSVVNKME